MRRYLATFCIFVGIACSGVAQDLRPVGNDLSSVLAGFGQSLLPNMEQTVLSSDGIGAASMGKAHFYVGFSGGADLTHGLLGFVDTTNFQVLNVSSLLNTYIPSSFSSSYTTLKTFFPQPDFKLVAGIKPAWGLEFLGTFSILPGSLASSLGPSVGLNGVTLSELSFGLQLRKVLVEDNGPFPAISIGAGYTYTNFSLGYALPTFSQALDGDTLTLGGTLNMAATLNTAGLDFAVSKKLLFIVPYLKVMPYYQWSNYSASISNFTAGLSSGGTPITPTFAPGTPSSTITLDNLNFLVAGGVEIALGPVILTPNASYNILQNTFALDLGLRGQF